jgi:hypothetical protein
VACMIEIRHSYRILLGKSKSKRPRWRLKCIWKDGTKISLNKYNLTAWTGFNWRSTSWISEELLSTQE